MREDLPPERLQENLKYLRGTIGLQISELAEIVCVDPVDIYEFESGRIRVSEIFKTKYKEIIYITNYFMVRLEDLIYENIEEKRIFSENLKEQLIKEMRLSIEAPRSSFYHDVCENRFIDPEESTLGVLKEMVSLFHQMHMSMTKYRTLRRKGKIPPHPFFEGEY